MAQVTSLAIDGRLQQGETLRANVDGVWDQFINPPVVTWYVDGVAQPRSRPTYEFELTQSHVGKTISVSAVIWDYRFGTAISGMEVVANSPVQNTNDPPIGNVVVEGGDAPGETIEADVRLRDPDGLGTFSFQWLRDGAVIPNAVRDAYTLTDEDIGTNIQVRVDYIDSYGTQESVLSESKTVPSVQTLFGDDLNNNLRGSSGDDIIFGYGGDDTLDGGLGLDLVGYSEQKVGYTLELGISSTTVSHRKADGDGTDILTSIELLGFAGEIFDLSKFGGTAGLSEQNFEAFIELYIAYFNRAPDAIGLNFWGSAFANGMSLDEIAAEFATQPETVATYPEGTSNTEFVTTVYNNILGRGPDQGGLDFWVNGLEESGLTRDTFILKLLGGVEDGNSDRTYLDNKVDIGAYFAVHKGMSDGENAKAVMDLFGNQDVSNTSGAKAAIDDYYADALDPTNGEFLIQVTGVLDNPFDVT